MTSLRRVVWAELLRARRTAPARLWLLGVIQAVLQGLGWRLVAARELTSWQQLLSWQAIYVTGLAAPLLALLAGLTVQRETVSRGGGASWRPVAPGLLTAGRLVVIWCHAVALSVSATLPVICVGIVFGLNGVPWERYLTASAVVASLSLLPVTIAYVLARIVGPYVAVGAGIVWQIAGTVQAESSHWLMMPWTWAVRPLLPLYEIHASGVPLEPGSPIVSCPVIPGVLTSLVGALVVAAVAIATAGVEARLPGNTRGSRLIAPIGALALGLRRTPLLWLTGCAVLLLIAVGFVYRPGAAGVVAAAAIVPIGCTLTAVTAWAVTAPAWRILALRRSVAQLCLRLGGSIVLLLGVVVAAGAAVDVLRGSVDLRALLVMSVSGVALLLVSLWLTTRWGPGMALSVGMAGWILSVTVTGSELATAAIPVWFLGYATWALAATTWPRAAVMCVMAAVLGAVAFSGWLRAARRSAATG